MSKIQDLRDQNYLLNLETKRGCLSIFEGCLGGVLLIFLAILAVIILSVILDIFGLIG